MRQIEDPAPATIVGYQTQPLLTPCVYLDLTQELLARMRASRCLVFPEQLVPTIL